MTSEADSCEEEAPALYLINLLRLTRSNVVALQGRYFSDVLSGLMKGCFVRVLLEAVDGGDQKYRMARVSGTRSGEEYSGYSFNGESTSTYLDLEVPQALGHTTNSIQLNSISNSDFTLDEYRTWQSCVAKLPTQDELETKWAELQPKLAEADIDVSCQKHSVLGGKKLGAKSGTVSAGHATREKKKRKLPQNEESVSAADKEIRNLKKQLEDRKDFPTRLHLLEMDELHALEDKVSEYMSSIRHRKKELLICKICMDKDVKAVLLPCRHQVLCEYCSYKVDFCPICRARIQDRILPH